MGVFATKTFSLAEYRPGLRIVETQDQFIRRVFDVEGEPMSPTDKRLAGAYTGAPIEWRPCETGVISETTECEHCRFSCKER